RIVACLERKVPRMIDAQPSLKAAEGLSGSEVAAYLLSKRWAASPSRVEGFIIFSKKIEGSDEPIEILLPVAKGFDEESRRVADALRTIGGIERKPVSVVADEIRRSDLDRRPAESIESVVGNGFSELDRIMSVSALESRIRGKQILCKAVGYSGTDVVEIVVMVDEHGRYEALVREVDKRDQPVRILVESSSEDPGTNTLVPNRSSQR